eukprot:765519-Hanusia_phi.AAC.3
MRSASEVRGDDKRRGGEVDGSMTSCSNESESSIDEDSAGVPQAHHAREHLQQGNSSILRKPWPASCEY